MQHRSHRSNSNFHCPSNKLRGEVGFRGPYLGLLDLVVRMRAWQVYVRELARVFREGAGNFWQTMYQGDGGLPSSVESVIGPGGAGGRAAGLRHTGLPPLPIGWLLLGGLRRWRLLDR